MPSFDVSSEVEWQNLDDALNQANKEISQRYDFKGVKVTLEADRKEKLMTIECSEPAKLEAVRTIVEGRMVKRGISLLSMDYQKVESAFGGSVRQKVIIQAGISKEKGKEIIAAIKDSRLKLQAQIQDEKVRISGKNRDDLQSAIALLRSQQEKLKVSMQFGNFRD